MITIQNNKRQRRILIFDSSFNLEESNDFTHEMFDAVFILASSPDEVKAILHTINPVTSCKCCYKPFLASRDLKGKLDEYDELIDNYTYDIDDSNTLDVVDEIINHVSEIGLRSDDNRFLSGNLFFIRLYRYLISRRIYHFSPELNGMSSMGYTIPIFELFFRQGAYNLNEYIVFNQSLLEKKYVRTIQFINKIYLCPKCLRSHLLYIENCPHCHSSAIKSEEVIHHFRCANISPEHTYNFGGQLRCPKCHQLLRHIGVDYDRPSVVYTCSNCENTFLQPHMTAVCTSCNNHADVSELTPYDITAIEITQEGQQAIVSPNIGFTIYTDFYDNYLEFDRFAGKLRMLSNLKGTGSMDADTEVVKIWMLNDKEETVVLHSDFIALFCKSFSMHRISSANHMVYIKRGVYVDNKGERLQNEAFVNQLDTILYEAASTIKPGERICYTISSPSSGIEDFVHSLYYISPFPDRVFTYHQDRLSKESVLAAEDEVKPLIENNIEDLSLVSAENDAVIARRNVFSSKVRMIVLLIAVAVLFTLAALFFIKKTPTGISQLIIEVTEARQLSTSSAKV